MSEDFESLQQQIGYRFRDPDLLVTALTHSSYGGERGVQDNERLEFFGDAVLAAVVADLLMNKHLGLNEGDLSRWRASLIREESLARHAGLLELGRHMRLGKGEEKSGGRSKRRLLASAYEALLGAMFQDSGYQQTRQWIAEQFADDLDEFALGGRDFKTELQEYTQRELKVVPSYKIIEVAGPEHEPRYRVEVSVGDKGLAIGQGATRKSAEQSAAESAIVILEPADDEGSTL